MFLRGATKLHGRGTFALHAASSHRSCSDRTSTLQHERRVHYVQASSSRDQAPALLGIHHGAIPSLLQMVRRPSDYRYASLLKSKIPLGGITTPVGTGGKREQPSAPRAATSLPHRRNLIIAHSVHAVKRKGGSPMTLFKPHIAACRRTIAICIKKLCKPLYLAITPLGADL